MHQAAPLMNINPKTSQFRRLAPLILGGVVLVAYKTLDPHVMRDHSVVYRFGPGSESVQRVDAVWTQDPDGNAEVVAGASYRFPDGRVPPELRTSVRAPHGEYWLALDVAFTNGTESIHRKLNLSDSEITVVVPGPPSSAKAGN